MDTCSTCGKKIVDLSPAMLSSGGPGWWCLCPPAPLPEPVFLNEEPAVVEPVPVVEAEVPVAEATVTFTPAEPEPAAPVADPGPEDPAAV